MSIYSPRENSNSLVSKIFQKKEFQLKIRKLSREKQVLSQFDFDPGEMEKMNTVHVNTVQMPIITINSHIVPNVQSLQD